MRIVVLVKEVPDTYGARKLDLETGLALRDAGDKVLDEVGERALEVAISYAESAPGTEVVALTAGPESAANSVRKALAMGADRAVHVADDALAGADLTLTSQVLAAALADLSADLILAGNVSTDGSGGVIPAMIAERLGLANVTALDSVELAEGVLRGERAADGGRSKVEASLPVVASITEQLPDPRFASLKGIMAAKKKPYDTLSLASLGVDADALVPRSIMIAVAEHPPREAGVKVVDSGDAGHQLAEFLARKGLV
ncbi:electron transfer flavoprotein subunit beta/FixA family protein [Humibacter sp. RRB41]|uniref:electron transfer flavoprotein subunit beta/FixA family protein n=1 Tax=Humibacter sp. RRB41 TaxID=2919946 RepID=UPI001FAA8301|nr:electron transfer flavoprotein subunit beta/FixA family protein [Humibacter sp. RRB41]